LLAQIAIVVSRITASAGALQTVPVDYLAAIPGAVITGRARQDLSKLQTRVVEELVVDRRSRAELLLPQAAGRNIAEASGVSAQHAITEISRESEIRAVVSQTTGCIVVVGDCVS